MNKINLIHWSDRFLTSCFIVTAGSATEEIGAGIASGYVVGFSNLSYFS